MKIFCVILTVLFSAFVHIESSAQEKKVIDENSNYVVIGAFNVYRNAVRFANTIVKQNTKAEYAFNENKKLYYVFVTKTSDRAAAIEEAKKLQAGKVFPDAWVYGKPTESATTAIDVNPGTNKETVVVAGDQPAAKTSNTTPSDNSVSNAEAQTFSTRPVKTQEGSVDVPASKEQNLGPGKNFFFKVFSTVTGDSVKGNIDLINVETNKKANAFPSNEAVIVRPVNKSGNLLFDCVILGYRGIKKTLNYDDPMTTAEVTQITQEGNQYVLPFELVRLKKGDIAVMYDLFFYKDAAIIRAESRSEVGLLVDMMKENLKYKIRLHGHTNGGGSGKIISMGSSKNFFSLNDSKDGFGSAKKLSEERAQVIKEYLIAQGIDEKRMEIKAWGGKKPLYDVDHTLAQSNVRVEVEILED